MTIYCGLDDIYKCTVCWKKPQRRPWKRRESILSSGPLALCEVPWPHLKVAPKPGTQTINPGAVNSSGRHGILSFMHLMRVSKCRKQTLKVTCVLQVKGGQSSSLHFCGTHTPVLPPVAWTPPLHSYGASQNLADAPSARSNSSRTLPLSTRSPFR